MKSGVGVDKLRNPAATATHRFDQGARHHAEAAHGSMCERHTKGVETRRAARRGEVRQRAEALRRGSAACALGHGKTGQGRRRNEPVRTRCLQAAQIMEDLDAVLRCRSRSHSLRAAHAPRRGMLCECACACDARCHACNSAPHRPPADLPHERSASVAAALKAHPAAAQCSGDW